MTRTKSSFRDDRFTSEEMEEAIELGEVGYCEIGQHHDWSDNVHSYNALEKGGPAVSFCDDCEPKALTALVATAIDAGLDHAQARTSVIAHVEANNYDAEVGQSLLAAIEADEAPPASPKKTTKKATEKDKSDAARHARGEFQLGPLLAAVAARVVAEARSEFEEDVTEENLDDEWWMASINLTLDSLAALADTPDTLAYQLDFDELYEDYATTGATPGWMIGEAAWRLVRDEARRELGLPSLY